MGRVGLHLWEKLEGRCTLVILTSAFCKQASLAGCSKLGEGAAGVPGGVGDSSHALSAVGTAAIGLAGTRERSGCPLLQPHLSAAPILHSPTAPPHPPVPSLEGFSGFLPTCG